MLISDDVTVRKIAVNHRKAFHAQTFIRKVFIMPEPVYAPNHTVDQATGFLESNGWLSAFDATRKTAFLSLLRTNSLGLYKTCAQMGLSVHTVNKHYQLDPEFKKAYDELEIEYTSDLEAVSRQNAMNPKSVIERIFQLKSLLPAKYADGKRESGLVVNISIDPEVIRKAAERSQIVEAEIVRESMGLSASLEHGEQVTKADHDHTSQTSDTQ